MAHRRCQPCLEGDHEQHQAEHGEDACWCTGGCAAEYGSVTAVWTSTDPSIEQAQQSLITVIGEICDWLPVIVRDVRLARGLSLRAAAEQAGTNYNTFWRVEHGTNISLRTALTMLRWIRSASDEKIPE